ncbi:ral guanine nucleotide dissociation stimulator-like isoform X1 [Diceros bicornis minor]|uniref:ral guanine nucleotide dissociation stimulator-like isoform X1 n=1 Tax=Diceros bicornis minor TaxID=77932 RepID=UPI0026E9C6A9|nr:ral guanine nucleotide dissociation stimulator-like isoform X1 [Diceros bicornis minor]
MAFPPKLVVEQFTMMDAELFQKVVSSPCLGSTWGKRNKPGNEHQTPNVQATVDHVRRVASFLIIPCLGDPSMTAQDREFEILKNFFSSCTVNSALQKTFTSHLKNTRGKFPGSQDPAAPSIFTTSPRGCTLPAPGMCVAEDSHGPGGKTGCSSSGERCVCILGLPTGPLEQSLHLSQPQESNLSAWLAITYAPGGL